MPDISAPHPASQNAPHPASHDAPHPASLFIVVGDPSADKHTAKLIGKIKESLPQLEIWGIGGPAMEAEGIELIENCTTFSGLGIEEVTKKYFRFQRLGDRVLARIDERTPSVVLLVDFGAFNLRLASALQKRQPDLPVYYFISPQVWGTRPWRINTIAKTITKMLVIFPFEEGVYARKHVPVRFVGHPLIANLPPIENLQSREEFCRSLGLNADQPIIAVFPGSRKQEIANMLPVSLDAIRWLLLERPTLQFVIGQANHTLTEKITSTIAKSGLTDLIGKQIFINQLSRNYELMKACDIVWAKSGTTTLEVTLFGKPMLIYYRGPWISYMLICLLKIIKRVGWPNLLAGYDLIPELLQLDCRADQLVRYTCDLLDVPGLRQEISEKLLSLRTQLGERDYVSTCAEEILNAISGKSRKIGTIGNP
jgi:lipid-A-disaccharide synthase